MFPWRKHSEKRRRRASLAHRLTRSTLERLESRQMLSVSVAAAPLANLIEGQSNTGIQVGNFTDTNTSLTASQYTVTVDYGDGSTPVTNVSPASPGTVFDAHLAVSGSAGTFIITDNHTFAEESGSTVPPFAFTTTVTESVAPGATGQGTDHAQVLDAPLSPGNPIVAGTPTKTTGGDTGNPTTAAQALANFETAIGGAKNSAAAPQSGGFRTITWDGVKVDGTDSVAGVASTTAITPGHTVGIPLNRFQGQGAYFGAVYAVSNDGFADVNPNVGGSNPALFPAFSGKNTFAMFNDNGIDFKFVAPSGPNTPPVSAASRGFGAIFLNVTQPGTTIQYFHGNTLLDTLDVPTNGTAGSAEFAGELFANPIVTNVVITLGHGAIFKFDGTTVTSGGADSASNNLVAVDDFAFAEPVPVANGVPIVSGAQGSANAAAIIAATAGTAFTGAVATFTDSDPNGNAKDFTATINWGDGHFSNGTVTANGQGGFTVSGTNLYALPGLIPVNVDVMDFGGGPGAGGSQPTLSISNTASVSAGDQNHRFVAQLYSDLLSRPVDAGALNFFGGALDAALLTRAQVVASIEASPEYRVAEVGSVYQAELNRPGDAAGLSSFAAFLAGGGTLQQVRLNLLASAEFYADSQTGGFASANQAFVDNLFVHLLGRHAESGGLAFLAQELDSGTISRATVVGQVLGSPEALNDVVNGYYQQLLHRSADVGGLSFFANLLGHGGSDDTVIGALAGSDEYFSRL